MYLKEFLFQILEIFKTIGAIGGVFGGIPFIYSRVKQRYRQPSLIVKEFRMHGVDVPPIEENLSTMISVADMRNEVIHPSIKMIEFIVKLLNYKIGLFGNHAHNVSILLSIYNEDKQILYLQKRFEKIDFIDKGQTVEFKLLNNKKISKGNYNVTIIIYLDESIHKIVKRNDIKIRANIIDDRYYGFR